MKLLLNSKIPWEIIKNGNVIDFGCGNGWFCSEMIEKGVNQIIGIDISEKLIKIAIELNKDNNCNNNENTAIEKMLNISTFSPAALTRDHGLAVKLKYYITDLNNFQLNETPFNSLIGSFDFAFSSFVTHYLSDLELFFKKVYNLLKSNKNNNNFNNGSFIFLAEHPMRTSTKCIENKFINHKFEGDENSRMVWPISNYSEEGKRVTNWAGSNGIIKYHYTIETYVNTLIKVGFKIDYLGELNLEEKQSQFSNCGDISIEENRPYSLFFKVSKN
ncbi:hypothetical protein ACTFIW_010846 [Dictyostelium discoideum]